MNNVMIVHPEASAFKVLIVDRDSMSSHLLADAVMRDIRCDATAIEANQVMFTLSSRKVDLAIIGEDISAKPGSGFELAHSVSCAYPNTSIVILLNVANQQSVVNAFRSGANGVFSRQQAMTDFKDCIEHVRRGCIWAGKKESNLLLAALKQLPAPNVVTADDATALTTREMQVVQYAAKGKTNRTIANELGLSEHTVKNYLFRAFEKLGVSSRVELLFYLTIRGHTFSAPKTDSLDSDLSLPA